MASEIRWGDEDVISPELVLVSSPEEARRARERLPAEPWSRPRAAPAAAPAAAPPQRPHLRVVYERPAAASPRRSRSSLVAKLALGAVLVAAGYVTEHYVLNGDGIRRVTVSALPTAPVAGAAASAPSSSQPPAAGAFVPARTWSWGPASGAHAYDVTLYRDGRIVLHARTKTNSLALPHAFRFDAGRYRWTVRPVPLQRGKPPIADSAFSLSAAAAEAANSQ
jgi:hypothetical protein